MERRLTIENNVIIVSQVPLDCVPRLQMKATRIFHLTNIKMVTVWTVYLLCARPFVWTVTDQPPHLINILSGDYFWHCEIQSYGVRDTKLI